MDWMKEHEYLASNVGQKFLTLTPYLQFLSKAKPFCYNRQTAILLWYCNASQCIMEIYPEAILGNWHLSRQGSTIMWSLRAISSANDPVGYTQMTELTQQIVNCGKTISTTSSAMSRTDIHHENLQQMFYSHTSNPQRHYQSPKTSHYPGMSRHQSLSYPVPSQTNSVKSHSCFSHPQSHLSHSVNSPAFLLHVDMFATGDQVLRTGL